MPSLILPVPRLEHYPVHPTRQLSNWTPRLPEPADYGLCPSLAFLRDQTGDTAAPWRPSMKQFDALRLFPSPRWNAECALEKGEYEAAFRDLSQAAQSNPELVPSLIVLAWSMSRAT